jgi:short-subunit dehydrogenase
MTVGTEDAMKAVLVGATRGMGQALSRLIAERGDQLFLLGIPEQDLKECAADLQARANAAVGWALCDLQDPGMFGPALDAADAALGGFDTLVITAGIFAPQEVLEEDLALTQQLLTVNFTNTVLLCEHARKRLLARGGGTLCVFSSVAGDRGRKPIILYGAGKAGLSRYLEGLDHKYRTLGLKTICVKPGFVKTGMTTGLKPPPFAGEPEQVAKAVLRAIDRGTPEVYAPAPWRLVMQAVRHMPRTVMRRVGF